MKNFFKKIIVFILTWETRAVLKRHQPKIVAITGSVGKTSTKDAVHQVLKENFRVRRSEKSYNSEIGLPLTVLGLPNAWSNPFRWCVNIVKGAGVILWGNYPEILVLEVGVGVPGDMERVTKFLKPDIVIVTRIAEVPVHVENFDSPEAVFEEKAKLVKALKPEGELILCGDDKRTLKMREETQCANVTYGFNPETNSFLGSNPEILYEERLGGLDCPVGILFRIDHDGSSVPVRMYHTLGRQHMYSALAALACASSLDINLVNAAENFTDHVSAPGRMRILEGIKNSTIIDDSYNSSPVAMVALFETLEAVETQGRKMAVLGDMLELGRYSKREHKKVGKHAARIFDILVTVGVRARDIAEGALHEGMSEKNILQFDDAYQAGLFLQNMLKEGDVVAVKGSQGSGEDLIRTERAIVEIMAHPEDRKRLLVRQEREWEDA